VNWVSEGKDCGYGQLRLMNGCLSGFFRAEACPLPKAAVSSFIAQLPLHLVIVMLMLMPILTTTPTTTFITTINLACTKRTCHSTKLAQ
jgi:hypothetical protein